MPKTAHYILAWNPEQDCYLLHEHACDHAPLLRGEDAAWSAWLAEHNSFAFQGKAGPLTLLKERRKRGSEGYWYAYRRQGKRMQKKYAGRSTDLTPGRLEAIAHALDTANDEAHTLSPASVAPAREQNEHGRQGWGSPPPVEDHRQQRRDLPPPVDASPREQLLIPKLRLPRLHASLVERARLFALLDGGRERKLTLLSAPAGFGKTTLLRQWVASRNLDGPQPSAVSPMRVAWVSLDAGDNDPARFWRYVITACRPFQADSGQFALYLLAAFLQSPFKVPSLQEVLTTFLNAVNRSSQEGMLVLEDYHLISEPHIHEAMTFLLDHLPPTLHLVILSRTDPPLPLSRLRAGGDLCELHAADLRFSPEETAAFLKQSLPPETATLSSDALKQLNTRLEGWAAGLRLFLLTLNGRVQPQELEHALTSFVGSHRTLQEYFITEVFSTQTEPQQHFLLYTSVLSRLTGSLCDAVTGRNDGEQMLAELERKGLFLEALDDAGQWYRYHALFAEAMRAEVRHRIGEQMLHTLSAKASLWYEQHGMLNDAIEAALQSQDMMRAANLIERYLSIAWNTVNTRLSTSQVYELHTVYRWLEQLPEQLMQQHPTLCFAYASALMFAFIMDQPDVNPQLYIRFEKALQMAEEGWQRDDNRAGLGNILAFRAVLARQQGETVQAIAWGRQALEWLPASETMWRSICLSVVSNDQILRGQYNQARKTTLEARAISEATRNRGFIRANTVMLSIVCFEQGELHLAAEYYRQMLNEAREVEDQDDIGQGTLGLAQLAYEWNDLSNAEQLAQEALACGQALANHEFQVQSTHVLARIEHARGQHAAAQQRCISLLARLSTHTAPMLYWHSLSTQVLLARLALSVGEHATVQRWMNNRAQDDEQLPLIYREMMALLEARWLLAQEKITEAIALLARWLDDARQNGRVRASLEIQMLMALAYAADRQMRPARSLLQNVLSQAVAEGYQRLFLDEGAPMAALLRTLQPYIREPALLAYLEMILHAFAQEGQQEQLEAGRVADSRDNPLSREHSSPALPAPLIEPLSRQELRVLRLLAAGRSNREIAGELIVSVNTIRSQIQSIYRKLNVNNRVEASEVARSLSLL